MIVVIAITTTSRLSAAPEVGQIPFTNAEVIQLKTLNMGDDVIIAKIRAAKDVRFDTDVDDLAQLKDAGISDAVIVAMLDRVAAGSTATTTPVAASARAVTLQTIDEAVDLIPIDGLLETLVAPFAGVRRWVIFEGISATARITDRRPAVLVRSDRDPHNTWWLIRLGQDRDKDAMNRYVDLESPGTWGGMISTAPDGDAVVQYDAVEQEPGLWRIIARRELKPGEYGLYAAKGESGAVLYGFGLDK
jgi:hypothetical protein